MFFNEKEKILIATLIKFDRANPNEIYTILYSDNTEIKASYDTDFESDNGLDLEEKDYEEYWACVFELKEITCHGNSVPCNIGELFEINYKNFPYMIKNSTGEIIVKNI